MLVCERSLEMYLEDINPMSRRYAEAVFKQDNAEKIEEALLRVTFHDEDWRWVQSYCLQFLAHPDSFPPPTARGVFRGLIYYHPYILIVLLHHSVPSSVSRRSLKNKAIFSGASSSRAMRLRSPSTVLHCSLAGR